MESIMGTYDRLTRYLPLLEKGPWEKTVQESTGADGVLHLPHVEYTDIVCSFVQELYQVWEEQRELADYQEVLQKNGLNDIWQGARMAEQLDGPCVLALMMWTLRAERFSPGTLLSALEAGHIQACLSRLTALYETKSKMPQEMGGFYGRNKSMFKDKADINHRNKADYTKNLAILADAVRGGQQALRTLLMDGSVETYSHSPDHTACTYSPEKSLRVTEKRLCRCIYFLNSSRVNDQQKRKCAACTFPISKLRLDGGYHIEDYEVASPCNKHSGIDLVWRRSGEVYAVEVKPADSTETILRMAAEILTYTLSLAENDRYGKAVPAICFFQKTSDGKLSAQWREYLAWMNNEDFKTIAECVRVFYFTQNYDSLTIHDTKEEPICG